MDDFNFRSETPKAPTKAEVKKIIAALPMPKGWTRAHDADLMRLAFGGFSLSAADVRRFVQLRDALTDQGHLSLDLQVHMAEAVAELHAEEGRTGAGPQMMTMGDFETCAICGGKGAYSEASQETPGATLTSPCWKRHGAGVK